MQTLTALRHFRSAQQSANKSVIPPTDNCGDRLTVGTHSSSHHHAATMQKATPDLFWAGRKGFPRLTGLRCVHPPGDSVANDREVAFSCTCEILERPQPATSKPTLRHILDPNLLWLSWPLDFRVGRVTNLRLARPYLLCHSTLRTCKQLDLEPDSD